MTPQLTALLNRTPAGRKIISSLISAQKVSGVDFLGKGKKAKVKNIFQKIGKYTSKVTGPIAKVAARIVGIPPDTIDALAKADPTAHKNLVSALVNSKAGTTAAAVLSTTTTKPIKSNFTDFVKNIKPVYIAGGAVLVAGGAYLILRKKKRRN